MKPRTISAFYFIASICFGIAAVTFFFGKKNPFTYSAYFSLSMTFLIIGITYSKKNKK